MRMVYPVKEYRDEGFIETKFEVDDDELPAIFEDYLCERTDIDFDKEEVITNRLMNVWLSVHCGAYADPDEPDPDEPDPDRLDRRATDVIVLGP
jgi:hypothetical protein